MEEGLQKEDLTMQLFLIVALGLAILTVIFALQNPIPVSVAFFGWEFEGSLALVLLLTFALGVLVSFLISIPAILKRRSGVSTQTKKIEELENRLRERPPLRDENYATRNNIATYFTSFDTLFRRAEPGPL